jgi:hypothetical protein
LRQERLGHDDYLHSLRVGQLGVEMAHSR